MKLTRSITGILTGLLFISFNASAQPTLNYVLDNVHIRDKNGCITVRIAFTLPINYVSHYPFNKGDELRIKIDPVSTSPSERETLFDREVIKPHRHKQKTPLVQVMYEGDIDNDFSITLLFSEEVAYEVGQGEDFRSILVSIRNPTAAPDGVTCPHLPKIKR
jgi:hypothetical protein